MKKLKLETSYTVNGNSTGRALDTLCIAVCGNDTNDIDMFSEGDTYVVEYVLEHFDYEAEMLKAANKAQLKEWLKNPQAQENALKEYTEKLKEAYYEDMSDINSPLAVECQKAIDDQADTDYREFIYGDNGNWAGILRMAEKQYGWDDISFETDKGEVYADIGEELIKTWIEDGSIDRKSQAYGHLQNLINNDAQRKYEEKKARREKNREERKRQQEYEAQRAIKEEQERQNKLKKLIKSK